MRVSNYAIRKLNGDSAHKTIAVKRKILFYFSPTILDGLVRRHLIPLSLGCLVIFLTNQINQKAKIRPSMLVVTGKRTFYLLKHCHTQHQYSHSTGPNYTDGEMVFFCCTAHHHIFSPKPTGGFTRCKRKNV